MGAPGRSANRTIVARGEVARSGENDPEGGHPRPHGRIAEAGGLGVPRVVPGIGAGDDRTVHTGVGHELGQLGRAVAQELEERRRVEVAGSADAQGDLVGHQPMALHGRLGPSRQATEGRDREAAQASGLARPGVGGNPDVADAVFLREARHDLEHPRQGVQVLVAVDVRELQAPVEQGLDLRATLVLDLGQRDEPQRVARDEAPVVGGEGPRTGDERPDLRRGADRLLSHQHQVGTDVQLGTVAESLAGVREIAPRRRDAAGGDDALAMRGQGAERHAAVQAHVVGGDDEPLTPGSLPRRGRRRGRRCADPDSRPAHLGVEREELPQDLHHDGGRREVRLAERAGEVIEPDLLDDEPGVLRLDHELGVDQRALGPQLDGLEHSSPDELEREVDVPARPLEQEPDERVVDDRVDRAPVPFRNAVEPVARDEVGARQPHRPDRPLEVPRIRRQVGVGVEHQLEPRGREAGPERAAELAVPLVADDADARVARGRPRHDLRRVVRRGVVDDDDLVVARAPADRLRDEGERVRDVLALVVHRDHDRDGRPLGRGVARATPARS